jgi:hypothetical protein
VCRRFVRLPVSSSARGRFSNLHAELASPATVLASANTILPGGSSRNAADCYAVFDFKRRTVIMANSGLPYPICDSAVIRWSCRAYRWDRRQFVLRRAA